MKNNNIIKFITLQFSFIIFSLSSLFTKLASSSEFLSFKFIIFFSISIILLGIYALLWQRILKENSLTDAFMNKAIVIIWGMIWGLIFFKEQIKINMIIGCILIVLGIRKVKTNE